MTETESPPRPFGQTLAYAHRALAALLHARLAAAGIAPERWYALHTITTHGPVASRDLVERQVATAPGIDPAVVASLLVRLAADGLIRRGNGAAEGEPDTIALTVAGSALHRSLREPVAGVTAELQAGIDPADLETTRRTLTALTERADALRAG